MNDLRHTQAQAHAQQSDATFNPAGANSPVGTAESVKVLKNTYLLLGATLLFSALTAGAGMVFGMPYIGLWMLAPYVICLWMVEKNKNNASGIAWVFALTGWLGLTLAPILSAFVAAGMSDLIVLSLAGTAAIFFAASGYVLTSKKNLSFMTGFLMTGLLVAFIAGIANVFLNIPGLGLAVSSMFMLLSTGLIMWQTSEIIHGGETNYISATVTLYVSIYNLFVSLLSILGVMSND